MRRVTGRPAGARHGLIGQFGSSQGTKGGRTDCRGRWRDPVPGNLLAGREPDRAGRRQAQAPAPRRQKRTTEDLWQENGHVLDQLKPTECANCIANAGYRPV